MYIGLLAIMAACGDPSAETASLAADASRVGTSGGTWSVQWSPAPDPIPLNELFALDATVRDRAGDPVPDAELVVGATLVWVQYGSAAGAGQPGNSMNTTPEVVAAGDGTFEVQGMLFHVPGDWTINFDVSVAGAVAERAAARVPCCDG